MRKKRKIIRTHLKRNRKGSIVLPNGQTITTAEQNALRSAVNSANRKRQRLISQLPKEAKERYQVLGVESDFVMRKKNLRYNKFNNKREFNRYLRSVQKLVKPNYIDKVMNTYRNNLNRAIKNVFNSAGDAIRKFLKSITNEELRQLSLSEEFKDIGYVYYAPEKAEDKLKTMMEQVAMIRARKANRG